MHEEEPSPADAAPPPEKAYNAALDQHMMLPQAEQQYLRLLKTLGLSARSVLELGTGTGALTRLIIDADAKAVVGLELDESLPPPWMFEHPRLRTHVGDPDGNFLTSPVVH